MASLCSTRIINTQHHQNWFFHPHFSPAILSLPSFNLSRSSSPHLYRSFCGSPSNHRLTSLGCQAGIPGPTPPGNEPHHTGITRFTAMFSTLWDRMQIFFAVFVWMSLFFWASASDRKTTGGRNDRNRFRK